MKGVFKRWQTWGATDKDGNYFVDKNGVPSKQKNCGAPPLRGTWTEWGDFSCQGSCTEDSFIKRTRTCVDKDTLKEIANDQCVGESEEVQGKCLKIDSDANPSVLVEPINKKEYDEDSSVFQGDEVNQCATGMIWHMWNNDYLRGTS